MDKNTVKAQTQAVDTTDFRGLNQIQKTKTHTCSNTLYRDSQCCGAQRTCRAPACRLPASCAAAAVSCGGTRVFGSASAKPCSMQMNLGFSRRLAAHRHGCRSILSVVSVCVSWQTIRQIGDDRRNTSPRCCGQNTSPAASARIAAPWESSRSSRPAPPAARPGGLPRPWRRACRPPPGHTHPT